MTTPLRVQGVSAAYGATRVLDDLWLEVPAGSLTALLGPSGCGKTTLLKVMAGLVEPTAGDVWLGDERLTGAPAERRGIGVVFQKPLLFPHLSVFENVAFGLVMRGVPAAAVRAEVDAALGLVQLEAYGHRRPRELSGGQEQRVSLARALVVRPRVLLLDEPLTALDEHLRAEMRSLIVDLQRRLGITTLFVTHDQREAAFVATQIALVLDGRVGQSGPPRDFYTAPVSAAVARFFGWCVLPCEVAGHDLKVHGGTLPRPSGETPSGGAFAAFHPSAARLALVPADADAAAAGLPGSIEHVVDRGYQTRIGVRLAGGQPLEVVQPSREPPCAFVPGAAVRIDVPRASVRWLS
jgi:ABC-type Fe3+/spermidine/putrescine transport system ATPase subunit